MKSSVIPKSEPYFSEKIVRNPRQSGDRFNRIGSSL